MMQRVQVEGSRGYRPVFSNTPGVRFADAVLRQSPI
jgi:hypothetical protein